MLRCCVTKWTDLKIKMPTSPYAPCIPTRGTAVPAHPGWIHEVKQKALRALDGSGPRINRWSGSIGFMDCPLPPTLGLAVGAMYVLLFAM
jgi:hypothetical protein